MNQLLFPYIFNILILFPVGLLTLLGGKRGGQLACQGKFPESEGFLLNHQSSLCQFFVFTLRGPS